MFLGCTLKYQWDLIHDPRKILAWAQDEEEGALIINVITVVDPREFLSYIHSSKTATFNFEDFEIAVSNSVREYVNSYSQHYNNTVKEAIYNSVYYGYLSMCAEYMYKTYLNTIVLSESNLTSLKQEFYQYWEQNESLKVENSWVIEKHHEHVRNQIREKIKLEYEVRRLIAEYEQAKRDAIWEDIITIGGGALSGVAIYFTAGTTTPWVIAGYSSAVLAVAGGGVKLAFDITDNLEYRKYVPDGLSGIVGVSITLLYGDTQKTRLIRGVLDVSEAVIFFKAPDASDLERAVSAGQITYKSIKVIQID